MEIAIYIIVGIISFVISFILAGFVEKFTKEDEKIQDYLSEYDENDEYLQSIEFKKKFKEFKKGAKVKFKLKFNLAMAILTPALIVPLYIFKDSLLSFSINSFLTCLLIISVFADIKACIIPDEVNIVGLITGLAYVVYNYVVNNIEAVTRLKTGTTLLLGGIVGFTIFFLIGCFAYLVFRREGMGGGDIKLMGVIGLFMGLHSIIQIFILSFFVGAIISIFLLITRIKKKDDYIPFGPFIAIATYITMFISGAYMYNQIYRYYLYKM